MSTPELTEKIAQFFKTALKLDPEELEAFIDVIDPIVTSLSALKSGEDAFSTLLHVFEVGEEDLPLSRIQSLQLWSLINDHQRNAISLLLRSNPQSSNTTTNTAPLVKDANHDELKSEQDPAQPAKFTPNSNDPTTATQARQRVEQKQRIQSSVKSYQTNTHNETQKKTLLEKSNLDPSVVSRFLGTENGKSDFLPPQSAANGGASEQTMSFVSSAIQHPATARELIYGNIDTEQLLMTEVDPVGAAGQKIIEFDRAKVKNTDLDEFNSEPAQSRGRDRNRPPSPMAKRYGAGNAQGGLIPDSRHRDRNYGPQQGPGQSYHSFEKLENGSENQHSNALASKYLQVDDSKAFNDRINETLPLQYKVYRGKVVEPKGEGKGGKGLEGSHHSNKSLIHVQLTMFPEITTTLDPSQITLPNTNGGGPGGPSSSRFGGPAKLQVGQDIFVKVLSDYVSVFKSELQALHDQQNLIRSSLGNDVNKLKHNPILKKTEPDISLTVSMLDVDQTNGADLNPIASTAQITKSEVKTTQTQTGSTLGKGLGKKKQHFSGLSDEALEKVKEAGKHIRASSHERWRQTMTERGENSTMNDRRRALLEKKKLQNGLGATIGDDELFIDLSDDEHHAEIDIADVEPNFIQGFNTNIQTLTNDALISMALTQMDGDLTRTARAQTQQAIERRQMKQQMLKDAVQQALAENKDGEAEKMSDSLKAWKDPLHLAALQETSRFASEVNTLKFGQQVESDIQADLILKNKENGLLQQNAMTGADKPLVAPKPQRVIAYGFQTTKPLDEQRKSLPIYDRRSEFLEMVKSNQICVVVAETGSGKTTQMGQYLFEAGWGNKGVIGCTQPRRVAATSVAARVADEVGCELGSIVGYSVRFDEKTTAATRIKYMTDGMLLREILLDPTLSRYSCMIIDEAHERGVNTDILLALIKAACKQRPDLRFIVTSATLDSEKFSTYLNNCPVFEIQGRTHPVAVHYSPNPESDYFEAALKTVMALHLEKPQGDILVFLTGEEEINDAVDILTEQMETLQRKRPGQMLPLDVFPIYSSLPSEIQSQIFDATKPGRRKCVIATNIAEASVTIDGIVYVIDAGVCKVSVYDPKQGIESLQVTPISQAQARQRAGRAGRTQPGECFRLYTEYAYENELTPTTVPELQRCDLASVILLLKALGINDLLGFDFIDPPATSSMLLALRQLFWLGAVDNDGLLTPVGARLAMLPVSPHLGKMLLVGADLGCLDEITTVVALVSGDELFTRPKDRMDSADKSRASFSVREGDHATLVNVFMRWESEGRSKSWCAKNFLSTRALETAYNVKLQLIRTLTNMKVELSSCGKNWALISRAVAAGLFMNAAKREIQEDKSNKDGTAMLQQSRTVTMYKSLTYGNSAPIHPSSSLTNSMPGHIVYQKMLYTTKEWLHTCTIIHPQWLLQFAPHLFSEKNEQSGMMMGGRARATKLTELSNPHHAPGSWRLEKR